MVSIRGIITSKRHGGEAWKSTKYYKGGRPSPQFRLVRAWCNKAVPLVARTKGHEILQLITLNINVSSSKAPLTANILEKLYQTQKSATEQKFIAAGNIKET